MDMDKSEWNRRRRIAEVAWLSTLTILVAAGWARDRHLDRQIGTKSDRAEVASLASRMDATESDLQALKQRPASISAKAFTTARERIEQRLALLEHLHTDAVSKQEYLALQSRVETIEARTAQAYKRTSATQTRPASAPTAPPAE